MTKTLWRQHYDENIMTTTLWQKHFDKHCEHYDENININIMIANKATWEWKGALECESQRSHLQSSVQKNCIANLKDRHRPWNVLCLYFTQAVVLFWDYFVNMILKTLKKELTDEVFNTNRLLFHLSVLLLFVHFVFLADPFSFEYPPPLHTVLVHLKYFNCEYFKYFNCEYFRYFFVAYSLLPHLAREIFWLKNQFLSGFGSTSFVSISKLSSHLLSILLSAEHWKPKHWDRSGG